MWGEPSQKRKTNVFQSYMNDNDNTAIHCSTSQSYEPFRLIHMHTATSCNTLQHTATRCNTLQHAATHSNTLQHTATRYNTLQHATTHCSTLQHIATSAAHCSVLQHTATHCNTLQHTATHCNTSHACEPSRMMCVAVCYNVLQCIPV